MLFIPLAAIGLVLLLDALPWYASKRRQHRETAARVWARDSIAIAAIGLFWWGLFTPWVNKDWVSDVAVLNEQGAKGTAYVAYYPGRSSLQKDIANAFASGLVSMGWRVELGTASSRAPTDLSKYDLVVFASPTYILAPAQRLLDYVATLDLAGKKGVVIASGLFSTRSAANALARAVRAAGCQPIKVLELRTGLAAGSNAGLAEAARLAAQALPLS